MSRRIFQLILAIGFGLGGMARAEAEEKHWAYLLPSIGEELEDGQAIDHFVDAQLTASGLERLQQANPARLIRRVYLDLIGLPPSIEEVDTFAADPSLEHYVKIVDRLLASPRFGEKWAIGWLDLARYADSDGYQRDGFRNVWPYRDWVIRAFNADMPFDQFTIEQLAGDLLPEPTRDQLIATGFHRGPILNLEAGTDAEEDRVKQVVDRVNTTGTVWLATSFECAQCHDHKYDPISIEDYYSMYAFFNQTEQEGRRKKGDTATMEYVGPDEELPLPEGEVQRRKAAQEKVASAEQEFVQKVMELCDALPEERLEKLKEKNPKTLKLINKRTPNFKEAASIKKTVFSKGEEVKVLNQLEKAVSEQQKRAKKGSSFQVGFSSRIMKQTTEPRETFVMKRGNFLTPGERVEARTPGALHDFPNNAPKNRLGLAQWLIDSKNPLTARVAVNRIWVELFGRGLVTTMEDFGFQSEQPTHPELLDWLAVTFRDTDEWSMKKTIRRIVLSETYRQSSKAPPSLRAQDPHNGLYSRGSSQRLKAELIRDNALSISGLLSEKMYGLPVRPMQPAKIWRVIGNVDNTYFLSDGEDLHRRGVYTIWRRSAHYPSFSNFDAPNRGACTVKRETSNTPLQALTLMNDPAYVEMAKAFAGRMQDETIMSELEETLAHGFRLAVARRPSSQEIEVLVKVYLGGSEDPWFDVATTLLNLHETITR